MARDHFFGPVILPFRAPSRPDEPDTMIEDAFFVDGDMHRLVVRIWADDTYAVELVNLASGASCPRYGEAPGRDERSAAAARPPTSATRR